MSNGENRNTKMFLLIYIQFQKVFNCFNGNVLLKEAIKLCKNNPCYSILNIYI